jgi:chromosome segregation ATPase
MMDSEEALSQNEKILKELRQKTMEVEEINMKMDEIQQKNSEFQELINKIGQNYDKELFGRIKENSPNELMRDITEKAKELEKFPRMNRHCVDWYDKYSSKYRELSAKFNEQESAETGISKLLTDLETQKMLALERNFKRLNQNFGEIFSDIVQNGKAELRLVKSDKADESQISHPS